MSAASKSSEWQRGSEGEVPEGTLQLDRHWDFYRRFAFFQRVGWVALGGLLAAALLGVFGPGVFGTVEQSSGALTLHLPRFARVASPMELRLLVRPEAVKDGQLRLWISQSWLGRFSAKDIEPQPASVEVDGDRMVYTFLARPESPVEIRYRVSAGEASFGRVQGEVGTPGGDRVTFEQWLWP